MNEETNLELLESMLKDIQLLKSLQPRIREMETKLLEAEILVGDLPFTEVTFNLHKLFKTHKYRNQNTISGLGIKNE